MSIKRSTSLPIYCVRAFVATLAILGLFSCRTVEVKGSSTPSGSEHKQPESEQPMADIPSYPESRRADSRDQIFGQEVSDPYRWLEDETAPEVQTWMNSQDELARRYFGHLPHRDQLADRARDLLYYDFISTPARNGGRYFYRRYHADREKAVLYWRETLDGPERELLDPNAIDPKGTVTLGVVSPSRDGRFIAYSLHPDNADHATLYVMVVDSKEVLKADVIPGARYARPVWTPDNKGFYYVRLPIDPAISVDQLPGYAEVRFHTLGTDSNLDPLIHARIGDPRVFIGVDLSWDGRWLFVTKQFGWSSTEYFVRDLQSKSNADSFFPLITGRNAHFNVVAWKEFFYISTDDGAPRSRLFRVKNGDPAKIALDRSKWQEIVPEAKDAVLDNMDIIGEHLVLSYQRNATDEIHILTLDGKPVRKVPIPDFGVNNGIIGNPDDDEAFYNTSSFLRPTEVRQLSIKTGEISPWYTLELPIDPTPYVVNQVWYASKDGTRVPMFVVHRKDLEKNGSTPFILSGYGGFNVSSKPRFSPTLYLWLEAGGGFAVPNLRGGSEFGEEWHKGGMLQNKQNVFDDFIAAAEFLIEEKYTQTSRLAIKGGSNGGLLVGAAMVQRPELFGAVICAVPLLDMVRYHLFGSGRTWISEYGSAEDEAQFRTLYAYSPYHHVKAGISYPPMLMLSADHDDRVDPMHARKMVASLQYASSSKSPVLLRIQRNAGHGGADQVKATVEESADMYAFLFRTLGIVAP